MIVICYEYCCLLTLGTRARSEGYCSCTVCMCVHSYLLPRTLELQNRDMYQRIHRNTGIV